MPRLFCFLFWSAPVFSGAFRGGGVRLRARFESLHNANTKAAEGTAALHDADARFPAPRHTRRSFGAPCLFCRFPFFLNPCPSVAELPLLCLPIFESVIHPTKHSVFNRVASDAPRCQYHREQKRNNSQTHHRQVLVTSSCPRTFVSREPMCRAQKNKVVQQKADCRY